MTNPAASAHDARVAATRVVAAAGESPDVAHFAEALSRLAARLGWADASGPFGRVIPRGGRVLVKPNWVMDENRGPWGLAPLLTDSRLVQAVVAGTLAANPGSVSVGDAPLQGCDFGRLLELTGIRDWAIRLQRHDSRFAGVTDFRRTTCVIRNGVRVESEALRPLDGFVLFDLGCESLLEPVTDRRGSFRVTQYDPKAMRKTHGPGRHRYLVARDVLEADVVINLPKLKTHSKAGITAALKNLVGINGNKEFLPHHRVNGSRFGGDCYPGASPIKRALELTLDRYNTTRSITVRRTVWSPLARVLVRVLHEMGDDLGVEGAWSGNDTVWRMCLDLNRILLYGRRDGTLADTRQRLVLHVVDAVVAGQGNGPLAPEPLALNALLAGRNPAAVDWIAAQWLGYEADRIPLVREAFRVRRWPITTCRPADVRLLGDAGETSGRLRPAAISVKHPAGWRDAARRPDRARRPLERRLASHLVNGEPPC